MFTSAWSFTHWNPAWAALFGDPPGQARNLARAQLMASLPGIVFTAAERERFEAALTSDLLEHSPRFAALWGTVTEHAADTKLLRHPAVGEQRLDCDVLTVPADDLHVVVYSATPEHPTRTGCVRRSRSARRARRCTCRCSERRGWRRWSRA